jgi:hypothetical protein
VWLLKFAASFTTTAKRDAGATLLDSRIGPAGSVAPSARQRVLLPDAVSLTAFYEWDVEPPLSAWQALWGDRANILDNRTNRAAVVSGWFFIGEVDNSGNPLRLRWFVTREGASLIDVDDEGTGLDNGPVRFRYYPGSKV